MILVNLIIFGFIQFRVKFKLVTVLKIKKIDLLSYKVLNL
jgi:hypothetical protein